MMRRFSTSASVGIRAKAQSSVVNAKPLIMRPPIEPRVSQVQTPDDHPLWQFFSPERPYIRKATELEDIGSAWSIPQLRRKSFEDLHSLWYICLKELNRLNREMRLLAQYENRPSADTKMYDNDENRFAEVAKQVKDTMWRLRHVLAERYHGYMTSKINELGHRFPALLNRFRSKYLSADSNADSQVNSQLERFQFAFFGINPTLDGNFPEPQVVKGLYIAASLRLERYGSEQTEISDVRDVREAYTLFTAEASPEGIASAIGTIKEIRSQAEPVPKEKDVEVLAEIMHTATTSTDL